MKLRWVNLFQPQEINQFYSIKGGKNTLFNLVSDPDGGERCDSEGHKHCNEEAAECHLTQCRGAKAVKT